MSSIFCHGCYFNDEGFIIVVILMVCIGGGLLFIFVRKQWIWTRESKVPETVHEQNKREKEKRNNAKGITYHVFKK
jgi:hypothetical protein